MYSSTPILKVLFISLLIPANIYAQKLDSEFRKAAKKGKLEQVQDFLSKGASINSIDSKGRTALMFASEKGHVDVVELLLQEDADFEIVDNKRETALDKAKRKKNEVIMVLEFAEIRKKQTVSGFLEYIRKYPNSKYIEAAKDSLMNAEFRQAAKTYNLKSLKKFVSKYPNSELAQKANE